MDLSLEPRLVLKESSFMVKQGVGNQGRLIRRVQKDFES